MFYALFKKIPQNVLIKNLHMIILKLPLLIKSLIVVCYVLNTWFCWQWIQNIFSTSHIKTSYLNMLEFVF